MANEAVIIELLGNGGDPVGYTISDGVAVTKGALMVFSGDDLVRQVDNSASDQMAFAGVAAHDKVASDGSTRISCYTNGIFDMKCEATNATSFQGEVVIISGANLFSPLIFAGADAAKIGKFLSGCIIGRCLEVCSASEVAAVKLGLI